MRISERLAMIAGDDDQRVVVEAGLANRVEDASEMAIRFVQDVQIAAEVVDVGHRFAQQIEERDAGVRLVRMMGLRDHDR